MKMHFCDFNFAKQRIDFIRVRTHNFLNGEHFMTFNVKRCPITDNFKWNLALAANCSTLITRMGTIVEICARWNQTSESILCSELCKHCREIEIDLQNLPVGCIRVEIMLRRSDIEDKILVTPHSCIAALKTNTVLQAKRVLITPFTYVHRQTCSPQCKNVVKTLEQISTKPLTLSTCRAMIDEMKAELFVNGPFMDNWCLHHAVDNIWAMRQSFKKLEVTKKFGCA
ncbi:MAG: hypothetical protein JHC35_06935 [Sulfuricurvum sp.]|jgi:hypothetical protein|uniref:hypothetical protein n=1 Tax=Sulfuricurvum sp. TaxID=2025608 RepID=UPI0025DAA018|nr:hypothetical protein [Sulfuricurvum sp.]MCI4407001.1 hypothetical protein [Sulfuricurvum sp.]